MTTKTKKVKLGLAFKGEYDPTVTYAPLDVVTWHNNMYVCGVQVKDIAPDKHAGSGWNVYGAAYWLPALVNFRAINPSVTANGFNYLQTFAQQGHLYTMITRTAFLTNVETQCSKIF